MIPERFARLFAPAGEYRSIRYDLRNIQVLLDALGNPQNSFRSVLIAGTNGKGSVAAMLSAMMPEAGLYTSPHLVALNERIRIGTQPISDADLDAVYDEVAAAADRAKGLLYPPTYFELMTAMAFTYFRDRADMAVLEVGMGGRLDAANAVRQAVSVITNIGYDHQEFLGATLDRIAWEKSGIIKGYEPVVIGAEAEFDEIRERAASRLVRTRPIERRATPLARGFFELDMVTPIRQYRGLRPRLPGRHQIENTVIAVRTAEILNLAPASIEAGVNGAEWPGRLEFVEGAPGFLRFLLDGAHNREAARALSGFLKEFFPEGVCMIFGCMADKDHAEMLEALLPHVRETIFTQAAMDRSKPAAELQQLVAGSRATASVEEAIQLARSIWRPDDTALVCGSLYVVGAARAVLH